MWIAHPDGFFSVVRKPGDTQLTVRARARVDLERLRKNWLPQLGPTRVGEGTDYPYRASVDPGEFGRAMASMGEAIDYSNFKGEVFRREGSARAHAYSKVWSALCGLERKLGK